ncbi:MAG: hypothetical protein ACRDFZ_08060 [Candidatus Limnocylindria bacterium]
MHVFIIAPENRPGTLATALEGIAQRGVNVITGGAATWGDSGAIALQTNDDEGTRAALQASGVPFREVEAVSAWLDDRPGTLADAARRLGNAGVNIEALFPIGMNGGKVGILFAVDNASAAGAALGELTGAAAG